MDILNYPNYRSVTAEKTYERIKPFFKEMGITRVANITGLDEIGIPVYIAVRPNSRSLSLSQGKGISPINAKVSAVMETIEAYHGEYMDVEPLKYSINRMNETGQPLCQYQNMSSFKNSHLDKSLEMEWIPGTNLLGGNSFYVPYETVHVDMRLGSTVRNPYFIQSSNGLASGNTPQEAINHAACELVERDSYACWTLQPPEYRDSTKVRIDSIDCDIACRLIERFYAAKTYVGIWNITSDIGLPAFLVRVIPKDRPPYSNIPPASGFACHPDRNLALLRALTEAAQSRLTFIAGARDDVRLSHYRTFTSASEYGRWYHSVFEQPELESYQNVPLYKPVTTNDVWQILKENLTKAGINQIISVDLSKPQFGIAVQKVIIPGLEGSESYSSMNLGIRARTILALQEEKKIYA